MSKAVILFLVSIIVFSLIPPGAAASKTTTLTFWTFREQHKVFMEDAAVTWNKINPNKVFLKTKVYPYEEIHNKLLNALQSGEGAPDLADIETGKFPNFIRGNNPQLVSLNSVVKPLLSRCVKTGFDRYAKSGQYYGVDYQVGAEVMYYNQQYLGKAGVDIDKIVTWDDYAVAGKKVMAATGKPMTTIEVSDHWSYYPLISQSGSDIFSKDGKVILDNPTNIKVLTFLKNMVYRDKIAIPAPGGSHHSKEYWSFMNNGGAASVWMPLCYMGSFTKYMPDLKGKMIIKPLPVWGKGGYRSAGVGGIATVVTVQAENKDLAVKFLAFAKLSRKGAIRTWRILGLAPLRWDVWDDPAMNADNRLTDYFGKGIFRMLTKIRYEINPTIINEKYLQAIDLLKRSVCFKVIKEQSQTPEQALQEAASELRKSK